ncbi:MAG: hypothetical protein ACOX6E_06860 [Syntrophomonadaceae bacterium]|jgi:hypothetical protein
MILYHASQPVSMLGYYDMLGMIAGVVLRGLLILGSPPYLPALR